MKTTKAIAAILILFTFCTSAGAEENVQNSALQSLTDKAANFQKGVTTYNQATSALGLPSATQDTTGGGKRLIYRATTTTQPTDGNKIASAIIPFVKREPTRHENELVVLEFNKDGILTSVMANKF